MTDERSRARVDSHVSHQARGAAGRAPALTPPRPIPPLPPRVAGPGSTRGAAPGDASILPGITSPSGTGQDARHRGWYWHWNTLITQYAPLLGLKGVGLLNSYTVWTDRREGSPHQGFAFPAQESEARFYGEGREELITLNKILVALDLIEIHKEMVVRQDDKGRRWRVPHNFYKVKDPKEGLVLGLPAVVRLLELARTDRNVFRQIRHIFGPQFAPIDRTSLWHALLPELHALPLWHELEARAARERRTPRKATTTESDRHEAEAARKPGENTVNIAAVDNGLPAVVNASDNAHILPTQGGPTIRRPADIADFFRPSVAASHAGFRPPTPVVSRADSAAAPTMVQAHTIEPVNTNEPSMEDEGAINFEGDAVSTVGPADDMYYEREETREETTRTTSTSRARAHEGNAGEHAPHSARAPSQAYDDSVSVARATRRSRLPDASLPPPRPSVSDLFTALAEQRRMADPPEPAPFAPLPDAPRDAYPGTDVPTQSAARSLPAPNAPDPTQPLPPEPDTGQEGRIIVRAVAVTDGPALGRDDQVLLAEIEAALTMANNRPPSDMEMSLYWQIAQDYDAVARGQEGPGSGLGWVLAAITEAVYSSGTGRVAPKYVARICERWGAEGFLSDGRTTASVVPPPPPQWPLHSPSPVMAPTPRGDAPAPPDPPPASAPAVPPTEAEVLRLWGGVLRRLDGILPAHNLRLPWFTDSRILAVEGDRAIVQSPDAEGARKLAHYRGLISRRLSDLLGYRVEAVFQSAPTPPEPPTPAPPSPAHGPTRQEEPAPATMTDAPSPALPSSTRVHSLSRTASDPAAPRTPHTGMSSGPIPLIPADAVATFTVGSAGETNTEVWPRVLALLRETMTDVAFAVWLEPTALIARDSDGTLVVGARNTVQRERLERQHLTDLTHALGAVLGHDVRVRIALIDADHRRERE